MAVGVGDARFQGRSLAGLTIVELYSAEAPLAVRLAGAFAGRMAADLGARVFKLDPGGRDPVRAIAPFVGGTSTTFAFLNAGKVVVDEPGSAAATDPLPDIVITDSAAGSRGPRARVTALLSLFSREAGAPPPASEFTVMALGGLLHMVGDPEREPLALAGHQVAYAAGLAAYAGIAAALVRVRRFGSAERETVHVSLLDTAIWLNWKALFPTDAGKPPGRSGSAAEWQVVRCADGHVALVYQEPDWASLCDLVGDERLRAEAYATRAGRLRFSREIAAIIEERFAQLSRRDVRAEALARRIPLGPVWTPSDLRSDPQYATRGVLAHASVAGTTVSLPRLPVIWSGRRFDPGAVPTGANTGAEAISA